MFGIFSLLFSRRGRGIRQKVMVYIEGMGMKRMFLKDRLMVLGFASYEKYLASPCWIDFRRRYYGQSQRICKVCGTVKNVTLHHITYERLGAEEFDDVIPVCQKHHTAIHKWLKGCSRPLSATQEAVEWQKLLMVKARVKSTGQKPENKQKKLRGPICWKCRTNRTEKRELGGLCSGCRQRKRIEERKCKRKRFVPKEKL